MAKEADSYNYIAEKIHFMKETYSTLRSKPDYYVFSALFIKVAFYKNPELPLNENDFNNMIFDGSNDCGIDILLFDPTSDEKELIIGQAKFCKTITSDEVFNALRKMADGYKDLKEGHYERANERLNSRFIELDDKVDEESRIRFVFYTSAPKLTNRTIERIKTKFLEEFLDTDAIEVKILFDTDIKKEIDDAASWKSIVESGKLCIDKKGNYLRYGDNAAIVNVSAFSIKKLYTEHQTNLLALNLRYHIKERKRDGVDNGIKNTIETNPESFWLKNNGITIICDEFRIDGTIVHLRNFSIINGGQTTYQLYKNSNIDVTNDFFLPCKIIRNVYTSKEEKAAFSLAIAQAANSQKPITQDDLKVNAPEQISFAREMRNGKNEKEKVFYQTKRGEKIPPRQYPEAYRKTKLEEVGKLCMAAVFQMPCVSRNKKKMIYQDRYYKYIFIEKQPQVAKICKELLYINHYFNETFKPKFKRDNENEDDAELRLPLANKARTICIAFTALAARYHQGNITDQELRTIFAAATSQSNSTADDLYKAVRDIGDMKSLLPRQLAEDMNLYDAALDKLFTAIIEEGILIYSFARDSKPTLTANSFLQDDKNYYLILKRRWSTLRAVIREVFSEQ